MFKDNNNGTYLDRTFKPTSKRIIEGLIIGYESWYFMQQLDFLLGPLKGNCKFLFATNFINGEISFTEQDNTPIVFNQAK